MCTFRQMMLSGMIPRLPSVAESSVRLFPSMKRFWSNGATEKACMIWTMTGTVDLVWSNWPTHYFVFTNLNSSLVFSALSESD